MVARLRSRPRGVTAHTRSLIGRVSEAEGFVIELNHVPTTRLFTLVREDAKVLMTPLTLHETVVDCRFVTTWSTADSGHVILPSFSVDLVAPVTVQWTPVVIAMVVLALAGIFLFVKIFVKFADLINGEQMGTSCGRSLHVYLQKWKEGKNRDDSTPLFYYSMSVKWTAPSSLQAAGVSH